MRKAVITGISTSRGRIPDIDPDLQHHAIVELSGGLETEGLISGFAFHPEGLLQVGVDDFRDALRIAMLFKTAVNRVASLVSVKKRGDKVRFDLQLSIGVGMVASGEAPLARKSLPAVLSRRGLNHIQATNQTIGIFTGVQDTDHYFETLLFLYGRIMNHWSLNAAELVHLKLWGLTEQEIAKELDISQPAVNQRSQNAFWKGLERILTAYQELEQKK